MRRTTVLCIRHKAMLQYINATIQTCSYIVLYHNTRIQGRLRLDWYHFGPESARRNFGKGKQRLGGRWQPKRSTSGRRQALSSGSRVACRQWITLWTAETALHQSPSLGGALAAGGGEVRKPQPAKGKEPCVANRLRPEDTERP